MQVQLRSSCTNVKLTHSTKSVADHLVNLETSAEKISPKPVLGSTTTSQSSPSFDEQLQGKRVLIVEDELFISMELEMSLEDCGATVVGPFASVEQVIERSEDLKADVAILDVNLNGVLVFPVADLLLQKDIPFVFHTGNASSESLAELYPGVSVIKKPASMPDLLGRAAQLT